MRYRFAPSVFACRADGRLVVLNVRADRYLLLPPTLDAAITRLMRGHPDEPGDAHIRERLCAHDLVLERCEAGAPRLCEHPSPDSSWMETGLPPSSPIALVLAAARVTRAMLSLRYLGLERSLRPLAGPTRGKACEPERVAAWAAGFAALRLAFRPLDQCLPLSLALATAAKRHHAGTRLVLGVRCNPFGAHAWVQLETAVLNDRLDVVRPFTPILVL